MPITPKQNETFEYYDNKLKYYYFAAQVNSFPPISAYISESKYYKYLLIPIFKIHLIYYQKHLNFKKKLTERYYLKEKRVLHMYIQCLFYRLIIYLLVSLFFL